MAAGAGAVADAGAGVGANQAVIALVSPASNLAVTRSDFGV